MDPEDEDEDTVAEMEAFSPGGGLCRLVSTACLPEGSLDLRLVLMLLLRRSVWRCRWRCSPRWRRACSC